MTYFNSNLAREAGHLVQWQEKFWARRYRAIVVSGEEGAQRERLKYVLRRGAKEGLVSSPMEWPGAHALRPLLTGEPIVGTWFDRTQEYAARRRGEDFERLRYATHHTVELSPLPCWEDLSKDLQTKRVAEIAQEIENETKVRLEEKGFRLRGGLPRHGRPTQGRKSKRALSGMELSAGHAVRERVIYLRTVDLMIVGGGAELRDGLRQGEAHLFGPRGTRRLLGKRVAVGFSTDDQRQSGAPNEKSQGRNARSAACREI